MASFDYDIGVIGGGAAGLTVAAGAGQFGAKTVLIEQEEKLGGDCLHYGCVPSKTLIKTARVYHQMKQGPQFGLPVVEPGPVDFGSVRQRILDVIASIQPHDSPERFCSLGVSVLFGTARFVDDHVVDMGSQRISAKYWVIATGSSPAVPLISGLDEAGFLTNKDIFYLDSLPSSLAILGAGPIAIEMAQAFCRLGSQVTIIQRSPHILTREDHDMADLICDRLRQEGVQVVVSTTVESIEKKGEVSLLHLQGPQGERSSLYVEKILVAQGRRSNTESLGLDNAGVTTSGKGIIVDRRLRTTAKHIYACGDVTGDYLFTHAAGYEGGVALTNIIFKLPRKVDYTFLPWCTYSDPELASIGLNELRAQHAGIDYSAWTESFHGNDRARAEGENAGFIKMLVDAKEKPIGVQIVGAHAGDLLGEWVAVLGGKVKLSTLAGAVHPYPTWAEINKRVAGNLIGRKIFSQTVKKGLKFFFGLRGNACSS